MILTTSIICMVLPCVLWIFVMRNSADISRKEEERNPAYGEGGVYRPIFNSEKADA